MKEAERIWHHTITGAIADIIFGFSDGMYHF